MAKKKNAKAKVPSAKQTQKKKPSQPKRGTPVPAWLACVSNPRDHESVAIPDERTSMSLKYTSRYTEVITTTDVAASASTNHGLLVGISPVLVYGPPTGGGWICKRAYDSSTGRFTGDVLIQAAQPPNQAAMFPAIKGDTINSLFEPHRYRLVAMEVKVSYLGTELQRGGDIDIGLTSMQRLNGAYGNNGNAINLCYGYAYNSLQPQTPQNVNNRWRRIGIVRNPDGSVIGRWIPSGVPQYAPLIGTTTQMEDITDDNSPCLFVMILGDTTPAASATGNSYLFDVVAHWEAVSASRYALAADPTPSCYDPQALAACLNGFEQLSSTVIQTGGGLVSIGDGHTVASPSGAWETISSGVRAVGTAFNTANEAIGTVYQAAQTPMGRLLVGKAAQYMQPPRGKFRQLTY